MNYRAIRKMMDMSNNSEKIRLSERLDTLSKNFKDGHIMVASNEHYIVNDAVLQGLIRGGLTVKSLASKDEWNHINESERFGLGIVIRQNDEGGFHGVMAVKSGHSGDYRYNFEEDHRGFQYQKVNGSHLKELADWSSSMSSLTFDEIREKLDITENQVPDIVHQLMPVFASGLEQELFAWNEQPELFNELGFAGLKDVPATGMEQKQPSMSM